MMLYAKQRKIWVVCTVLVAALSACGAFAASQEGLYLYADVSGEIQDPQRITDWQPVQFPLWLDEHASRYWLKIPVRAEDDGKWLSLGWPNIWQWQMIRYASVMLVSAGGEVENLGAPIELGLYKMIFPLAFRPEPQSPPESLLLRLDCLPCRIFIPDISIRSPASQLATQARYVTLFSVYLGMVLILIAAALVLLFLVGDRIFLYYAIMLFGGTAALYAQVPVYSLFAVSFASEDWRMLFHIAMVVFYVGTLLFAGSFLDPGKKHTRLHRYLHTVIMLCILYASCYRLMGTMLQENLLYVLDVFALSPILMALWLWQKGSRVALYYVIINAVYLPIYGYFLVVTQVAVMPIVPLYLLLIAGSLTESIGYSAAVAYRLYATLQHKHSIEEQNRVLRREQMESALLARDAELRMLRFQMNPHFLFNALNSLIAEIGECPKHAVNMAQKLSEYLRYTLTTRETIRVADELEAVQRYLELENFRYEDKLVVRMDVDEQIADIRIPMFTLQPLVENALKYGMQTSPMPLQVDLKVRREGNVLRIAVSNTGHWVQGQTESTGIGLQNIQERLKRNACGEGSLRWEQKKDRVEVCLIIPIG